jgi:hypothetical protein
VAENQIDTGSGKGFFRSLLKVVSMEQDHIVPFDRLATQIPVARSEVP